MPLGRCASSVLSAIIGFVMTNFAAPGLSNEKPIHEGVPKGYGDEASRRSANASITLVVCGEPVVGQALVLLLQGVGYEARFLPFSHGVKPVSREELEGADLLLLTPMHWLDSRRRKKLPKPFTELLKAAGIPVLELVFASSVDKGEPGRSVSWPCNIEELQRRVREALLDEQRAEKNSCSGRQIVEGGMGDGQ